jgi:hypothetical protein
LIHFSYNYLNSKGPYFVKNGEVKLNHESDAMETRNELGINELKNFDLMGMKAPPKLWWSKMNF